MDRKKDKGVFSELGEVRAFYIWPSAYSFSFLVDLNSLAENEGLGYSLHHEILHSLPVARDSRLQHRAGGGYSRCD